MQTNHSPSKTNPLFALLSAIALMPGPFVSTAARNNVRGVETETEDVVGQGPDGPVVEEDGATLRRTNNGISFKVQMPTPDPETYASHPEANPSVAKPDFPEGVTLWVFVFDAPEDEDWMPAFLGGGHPVGEPKLTLSGHISTRTEPFAGEAPQNPRDAEVHGAVAPHGELDPGPLPGQINRPGGGPGM